MSRDSTTPGRARVRGRALWRPQAARRDEPDMTGPAARRSRGRTPVLSRERQAIAPDTTCAAWRVAVRSGAGWHAGPCPPGRQSGRLGREAACLPGEIMTEVSATVPGDAPGDVLAVFAELTRRPLPDGLVRTELLAGRDGDRKI